jgi:cytochrome c-type biogenesis protein CcmE
MSDLDKELLDAIRSSEAQTKAGVALSEGDDSPGVSLGQKRSPKKKKKGNWVLLAVLLGVGAAILGLVFSTTDNAIVYSMTTDKLLNDVDKFLGKSVRVEGDLVTGTLVHRAEPCEYRFSIQKGGKVLPVRYEACIVPDTFKDVPDQTVQVTAEGKLTTEGYFAATNIMAKCPSKYEMQERAKKGETAPHSAYPKSDGARLAQ